MQLLAVLLDPLLGLLRSLLDVGKALLVVAPIDIGRYANISNRANDTEEQEELERSLQSGLIAQFPQNYL